MTETARSHLGPAERSETLQRLAHRHYDVLVVGGGVTGAGVALDAATRGLSVALVEKADFASGTSSRSGKLIHGGLRYLEQRDFRLVREALRERALMLTKLCPHLVRPIRFLYPLRHRLWERVYVGAGLILYDTIGGARALPRHRHLTKRALQRLAPGVDTTGIVGGISFYDAQIDDARHTIELVRTAAAHGADVASRTEVVDWIRDEGGAVEGAIARDAMSGRTIDIHASQVVSAAGVWTDLLNGLVGRAGPYQVQASKGVHIMVPRDRIASDISMFVRAEDSVLFVRAWGRHWLIGTTDTAWQNDSLDSPSADADDIDYLLRNVNAVLSTKLARGDIDGVFAGLRPLVRVRDEATTSKLSREHLVYQVAPGLTTVVGGKYTTYRVMAKDVLDKVVEHLPGRVGPCRTATIPTIGASGLDGADAVLQASTFGAGLDDEDRQRLLRRYGGLITDLVDTVDLQPELARRLPGAPHHRAVEVAYAVTAESALHLDDVLERRTHIAIDTADRGVAAAPSVAALMAPLLGWTSQQIEAEVARYRATVAAELTAQQPPADLDTETIGHDQSTSRQVEQEIS